MPKRRTTTTLNDELAANVELHLEALGAWRDGYRPAIERYVRAVMLARSVQAQWEADGSPLTDTGSMGQIVAHPLVKLLRDCERDAHALGAALGLDPVSAARIAAGKDAGLDWETAFPELNEIRSFEPGQPGYNADLDG